MSKQVSLLISFFFLTNIGFGQQLVNGYVLSEDKEPLIGANISLKGTSLGTISDMNGEFSLTIPDGGFHLVVSYTGFATQELTTVSSNMEIILAENKEILEEVIISGFAGAIGQARRRMESIQRIPESVITLTSEQIESRGINNLQSFAGQVPNFQFNTSQNVGVNFITVRGIPQIRNGDAPIAFVVDGVTIPDANLLIQEQFDLALVEIVKGPQGALYGKNAIAGAINILTQKPTNYSKNKITLGYAEGNTLKAQATFSGPLSKNKVYYRLSGSYKKSDGLWNNVVNDTPPDFYDDINLRGQLKFDFTDRLKATLSTQYGNIDGGALWYFTDPNRPVVPTDDLDNIDINSNELGVASLKNSFSYLKLEYLFDDIKFKSITSYNDAKRNHEGDLDHGPLGITRQFQNSNSKTFNQEFRLGSKTSLDAKLTWDVGAFYQQTERLLNTIAFIDFGWFAEPPGPTGTFNRLAVSDFTNTYNTFAIFGFADYKLSDQFTVSVGLRYDNDQIDQEKRDPDGNVKETPNKTESAVQPKLSLAFQASDNFLVFANYGRGYRVGGFNAAVTPLFDTEYRAETSDNFEIGIKSTGWNDRLTFNAGYFFTSLNDQQQYGLSLVGAEIFIGNYNYEKSRISGFEADLQVRVSSYLDILAGVGVSNAEIIDGGIAGLLDTDGDGIGDTPNDRSGFENVKTPFVPQNSYNFGLQSRIPFSDMVAFVGNLSLKGTGEIYWHEEPNNPQLSSSGYSLLDLRLGIDIKKKYSLTLWGNNLSNKRYAMEYFSSLAPGGPGNDLYWLGLPRQLGVDVTIKF